MRDVPVVTHAARDGEARRVADGDDDHLSRMFAALASTVRLDMLRQLRRESDVSACGFEAQERVTQSTVSSHLRVLREAGLVRADRCGTSVRYFIEPGALDVIGRALGELRPRVTGRPGRPSGPGLRDA